MRAPRAWRGYERTSRPEVGAPTLVRLRPFFERGGAPSWYLFLGRIEGAAPDGRHSDRCQIHFPSLDIRRVSEFQTVLLEKLDVQDVRAGPSEAVMPPGWDCPRLPVCVGSSAWWPAGSAIPAGEAGSSFVDALGVSNTSQALATDRIIHAIDGLQDTTGAKGQVSSVKEREKLDVFLARGCGDLTVELGEGVYGKELVHSIKRSANHAKHELSLIKWPVVITNRELSAAWCEAIREKRGADCVMSRLLDGKPLEADDAPSGAPDKSGRAPRFTLKPEDKTGGSGADPAKAYPAGKRLTQPEVKRSIQDALCDTKTEKPICWTLPVISGASAPVALTLRSLSHLSVSLITQSTCQ
ncbi:unnamed protein product [Symbiodinium microadriaticum]|nr:unnamed protein product [Symbiodinium microadriaticum]